MGLQAQIPAPKAKKQYEEVEEAAVVIYSRDGRVLLRRCREGERWAGLWDFPRVKSSGEPILIRPAIEALAGVAIGSFSTLAVFKHGVTRYRITLRVYSTTAGRVKKGIAGEELCWKEPWELDSLPLCTTGRKIARLL
jgi:A/G-specific adenine glycosylase